MQLRLEDIPRKIAVDAGPVNFHFTVSQPKVTLIKRPPNWRDRLKDSLLVIVIIAGIIRAIRDGLELANKLREWFQSFGFASFKQREKPSDLSLETLGKNQP